MAAVVVTISAVVAVVIAVVVAIKAEGVNQTRRRRQRRISTVLSLNYTVFKGDYYYINLLV